MGVHAGQESYKTAKHWSVCIHLYINGPMQEQTKTFPTLNGSLVYAPTVSVIWELTNRNTVQNR